MPSLLARFAESYFWLARYMERAENLARILDVNETFAQDSQGVKDWLPIVELHTDTERFFTRYEQATADAVIHFYVLDRDNPTSIISDVRHARDNARAVRHLVSTEAWSHLNVFYNRLAALQAEDLRLSKLSRLCATIKEDCQLHTGIVEGTLYRDQSWFFYQIGRQIERADSTTRLLDINYHRLVRAPDGVAAQVDASQWNALLRSVAGYQAFRRVHPRGMQPSTVAAFLLFDSSFPRAMSLCISSLSALFEELMSLPDLRDLTVSVPSLEALRRMDRHGSIDEVLGSGLHEFLDDIQSQLIELTGEFGAAFFEHELVAAS